MYLHMSKEDFLNIWNIVINILCKYFTMFMLPVELWQEFDLYALFLCISVLSGMKKYLWAKDKIPLFYSHEFQFKS